MINAKYGQVNFWKPSPLAAAYKNTIWKKYLSALGRISTVYVVENWKW